jgi:hypothetical protein
MLDLNISESLTERLMKFTNALVKDKRINGEDNGTYLECQCVEHIRYPLERESYVARVFCYYCFHGWSNHKVVAMYGRVKDFAKCSDPNMYEVSYDQQQGLLDITLRPIGDQVLQSV